MENSSMEKTFEILTIKDKRYPGIWKEESDGTFSFAFIYPIYRPIKGVEYNDMSICVHQSTYGDVVISVGSLRSLSKKEYIPTSTIVCTKSAKR